MDTQHNNIQIKLKKLMTTAVQVSDEGGFHWVPRHNMKENQEDPSLLWLK